MTPLLLLSYNRCSIWPSCWRTQKTPLHANKFASVQMFGVYPLFHLQIVVFYTKVPLYYWEYWHRVWYSNILTEKIVRIQFRWACRPRNRSFTPAIHLASVQPNFRTASGAFYYCNTVEHSRVENACADAYYKRYLSIVHKVSKLWRPMR
jgi:hypothetical protein